MKKYTATVLIADGVSDGQSETYHIDGVMLRDIVPVNLNFDPLKPLGRAHLRKEGDRVVADLELDAEPPEDMRVPAMGGLGSAGLITITSVGLSDNNVDPRIEPIEEVDDDQAWCDCGGRCPDCNPIPTRKRNPVPEGCEECPGCPDCLEEVKDGK